jgi:hypothetical protein
MMSGSPARSGAGAVGTCVGGGFWSGAKAKSDKNAASILLEAAAGFAVPTLWSGLRRSADVQCPSALNRASELLAAALQSGPTTLGRSAPEGLKAQKRRKSLVRLGGALTGRHGDRCVTSSSVSKAAS